MYSNIENRTDKTFISLSHIWNRTERTYLYIPTFRIELLKVVLIFNQKFGTYIYISTKTRNFQLPYFLTFHIDAYSVSTAKVVKMLYEVHPTYDNISNILFSISI